MALNSPPAATQHTGGPLNAIWTQCTWQGNHGQQTLPPVHSCCCKTAPMTIMLRSESEPLFCSLAVVDPRVGHTKDILSPFIPVLCHSDWLFHGESCPCVDVVHPGHAWPSLTACTWHSELLRRTKTTNRNVPRGSTKPCVLSVITWNVCSSCAVGGMMAKHSTYEDWSDSKETSVTEGALLCENMLS